MLYRAENDPRHLYSGGPVGVLATAEQGKGG